MKNSKITLALFAVAVLLAAWALKANAELSESEARQYVKRGALIVDVRTVEEFKAKSLTNVINIPLDDVTAKLPKLVTNKSDVVLLHCRSGRRSGIAEGRMRELGFTNVFNIGSFEKAQKIVSESTPK